MTSWTFRGAFDWPSLPPEAPEELPSEPLDWFEHPTTARSNSKINPTKKPLPIFIEVSAPFRI
ncbi:MULTISPECIES: hypothetical protein [unclassified Pseudomonas]|uniref:hypothetical protein n=1 Tax=unclassified Pseudomonas TaxID=196821 RepID=UPI000485D33A|nr:MULTISPECIES: hypothetical protein [unclassified Pseudomonas]